MCVPASGPGVWPLWALLIALPWLNPHAGGPSPVIAPWLFTALCAAIVFATRRRVQFHASLALALSALAGWALVRTGATAETLALAGACLVTFLGACAASEKCDSIDRAIAWGLLCAALVSTAIALLQYFRVESALEPWVSLSSVGEAYANLRQRNQFATLTVVGMASLIWLERGGLHRWIAVAAMSWLAIGNAATTSRTGLLQILALAIASGIWPGRRRERMVLVVGALLAYSVAAALLPFALEEWQDVAAGRLWERVAAVDACSSRTQLWSNVLHLIGQKPWTGWGWGELDYAHFMTLYPGQRFCDILDNAHNLPLHLAVELGIPAALAVCGAVLWATVRAKPWTETDPARQMAWGALAVIGLHSLVEYPLWYGPFELAVGLCLGLLLPNPRPTPASPVSAWVQRGIAALAIAICAYAAWDYWRVSQVYLLPEARARGYRDDPLAAARKSWLFRNQARFAELTLTPLTLNNASWIATTAAELLHYSPEPRVIEKLIESLLLLGRNDEALWHMARFRAAFPADYASWRGAGGAAAALKD